MHCRLVTTATGVAVVCGTNGHARHPCVPCGRCAPADTPARSASGRYGRPQDPFATGDRPLCEGCAQSHGRADYCREHRL
jgi:hypothetical protein